MGAGALWLARKGRRPVSAWLRCRASTDTSGQRKPLVLGTVSVAARPLYALAGTPLVTVMLRAVDRVGKGVRTAPRDALLWPICRRSGSARGSFHRAFDHAGVVAGPRWAWRFFFWFRNRRRVCAGSSHHPDSRHRRLGRALGVREVCPSAAADSTFTNAAPTSAGSRWLPRRLA